MAKIKWGSPGPLLQALIDSGVATMTPNKWPGLSPEILATAADGAVIDLAFITANETEKYLATHPTPDTW